MIKIGPVGYPRAKSWDEKGGSEIVQIFVWHGKDFLSSLQFQYFKDGNLVLSARNGWSDGNKFDAVRLNYPSEYITGVSGISRSMKGIVSITFTTNLGTYGPFGDKCQSLERDGDEYRYGSREEFRFQLGKDKQFDGFHGSADQTLGTIGVYIKPIQRLNIQPKRNQDVTSYEEDDESVESQQLL